MYMSRYAINEWGMFFLQNEKGFPIEAAGLIIGINTVAGIVGTVCAGWLSDKVFKGDRKYPAFVAGILESIALVLFLYGGDSWFINILAMVLFGIAIGVLICFIGGLMAVDLVPRKATGAALGIVGLASYVAAGLMNVISGVLINDRATYVPVEVQSTVEVPAAVLANVDDTVYNLEDYDAQMSGYDKNIEQLTKDIKAENDKAEKDTNALKSWNTELTIAKYNKELLAISKDINAISGDNEESKELKEQRTILYNGVLALSESVQNDSLNTVIKAAGDVYNKRHPETEKVYDFSYVSIFWIASAIIAFLLPVLNWKRKKMQI
jgi:hypothetical protein